MSKYLVFQDAHIKGTNSINRTGNYFSDLLIKYEEILMLAKQYKVKAIIDNGDLFHAPEPTYKILDEIADRTEKNGIPVYSLYGNHCMLYRNIESSKYTGLGHLFKRSNFFKYLPDQIFDDMEVISIDYSTNIEENLKNNNLLNFKTNKYRVAFIHAFVCETPFPFATHVCCKDLKNSGNCDIFIGHYHKQYNIKINTTNFINLGCIGRNSITEVNIKPSVAIIDTEKRSYEIRVLESAKKAEEIFDLKKVEEFKDQAGNLDDFIKSVENINFQADKLENTIKLLAKENKYDKAVLDNIDDRITTIRTNKNE